jgi:2-polyprenyl-6-methoxyphenol hydroxylase-like FAD-dependent oxidoreductase
MLTRPPRCLQELGTLLPKDIPELATCSPNYHLNKSDTFTVMDGLTHQVLGVTNNKGDGGNGVKGVFANRLSFRDVLSKNINVQYSKQFVRYEEDRDGVTAYFKDGSSARGDILVGADGSKSPVRGQLLRGFKPDPSTYLTGLCKVILTKDLYQPLLEHSSNGPLMAAANQKAYCLLMEYLDKDTAAFNWNVAWRSVNVEKEYAEMVEAGPAAHLQGIKRRMKHWPPAVVKAIAQSKPSDLQWPPIRLMETVLPPYGLPKARVTLLGDAAHSMVCISHHSYLARCLKRYLQVPFRGMGANTAFLDACDLGNGLIEGIRVSEDLQWVLQKYEEIMIPRGRQKVLESRATADSDDAYEVSGGRVKKQEASSV